MIVSMIVSLLAAAPQTAAAPAPSPTEAAPKPEKRVCRSETATGSTIPKRICHTKSEWAQIEADNARNVDAIRNRAPSN